MCGRFALTSTPEELARVFDLEETPAVSARYNVAPGQKVWVVRRAEGPDKGHRAGAGREARALRWGLVPGWSQGPSDGRVPNLINARAETAATKPAFRSAFRERRCLIPANGFFEWAPRGDFRQPYWIAPPGGGPIAFAGLWEAWQGEGGEALESCAILTSEALGAVRALHSRSPVLLDPEAWNDWLAEDLDPAAAAGLLAPRDAGLVYHPVGTAVNRVAVDEPGLLEPVAEAPNQMPLL